MMNPVPLHFGQTLSGAIGSIVMWGGPPGPRGTPSSRSSVEAGRPGAGRGPGGPPSPPRAGIPGRRRSVVFPGGRPEQLRKHRLQRIGPNLITLQRRMQLVALVHHAVEQFAVAVCQPVVDIEEPDPLSVRQLRQVAVDL